MLRVHLSEYKNETSEVCHWHVPAAHYLESWGDTRSYDGTVTIMQPLIEPLYEGKTAHELLAIFSDQYDRKPYDIVRTYWQTQRGNQGQAQTAAAGTAQTNQAAQQTPAPAPAAPAPSPSPSQDFENMVAAGDSRWLYCRLGVPRRNRRVELGLGQPTTCACTTSCRGYFRTGLPSRSVGLRRTLCQQRLAPGTAQATDQDHLGQRCHHQSEFRSATCRRERTTAAP